MGKLHIQKEKCVHCGACTGICPSNALTMRASTWTLTLNEKLCTGCNLCVKSCPLRAIKSNI